MNTAYGYGPHDSYTYSDPYGGGAGYSYEDDYEDANTWTTPEPEPEFSAHYSTSTSYSPSYYEAPEQPTGYSSRDEAIIREIIEPLNQNYVPAHASNFDVEGIASIVLSDYEQRYASRVTPEQFWNIVELHRLDVHKCKCAHHIARALGAAPRSVTAAEWKAINRKCEEA